MQNFNISDDQYQQQLISSEVANLLSQLSQSYDQAYVQSALQKFSVRNLAQSFSYQSINQVPPVMDEDDGFIIKMDKEQLKQLKEQNIKNLIKDLKLDQDLNLLSSSIPEDNIHPIANSLMNIQNMQIQKDLSHWLKPKSIIHIGKTYKYIRYFYFPSSESYLQDEAPPIDYGLNIVQYKNQITVLIGVIELVLDQPLLYQNIFKKMIYYFESFEKFLLNEKSEFLNPTKQLKNVIKLLFLMRIQKTNSFQVNQQLFRYINKDPKLIEILKRFMKYLYVYENMEYKEEEMEIFWRTFNVQVKTYFNDTHSFNNNSNEQQSQDYDKLEISIFYESFSNGEISYKNCYLLYMNHFMQFVKQDNIEILPLKCKLCENSSYSSFKYIIEKVNQRRYRLCYKCYKKQSNK